MGLLAAIAFAGVTVALDLLLGLSAAFVPLLVAAAAVAPGTSVALMFPAVMRRADTIVAYAVRFGLTALGTSAVYVLLVVGLVGRPRGGERWVLAAAMAASLVLAVLAAPVGRRINALANQLAFGQTRAPGALLEEFARRLTRPLSRDEQLLQLAESVRQHLVATRVDVWVGQAGLLERAVSLPHREPTTLVVDEVTLPVVVKAGVVADMWISVWLPALAGNGGAATRLVPATHGGELLGLIVVERAVGAEPFTVTDERLLGELGPRLGLALQTMKLDAALRQSLEEVRHHAEELQASRARIVEAADTERRRIERDLHDGAQQRLIALGLKAAMAGKVIHEDPDRAAALVEELRTDVKASAVELRALSHGIYPPTLEGEGLAAALSETGGRFPFRVDVETDGVGRYGPSLEAAVFFCCLEALQNAAKHAGEDPCVTITLAESDGALSFSVSDDGPGFTTSDGSGTGLVGMRDRAGAVGGTVSIESSPGVGTTVRGWVPVGQDRTS
ncbi:MAG TPA: GAF domain-containing sensor histidine kinase [Acidimicrobiales bacterium]|nr:GAF domain-containing sensor histidine kinase [Acidimicrobiales bacterium]